MVYALISPKLAICVFGFRSAYNQKGKFRRRWRFYKKCVPKKSGNLIQ